MSDLDLAQARQRVDALLERHLADKRARLADAVHAGEGLTRRGGKRVRPALVLAGHAAVAPIADLAALDRAAAAFELLQTYLLIQDDWMDGDDVRRGGPSAHALLRTRITPAHRADSVAILASDLASADAWNPEAACWQEAGAAAAAWLGTQLHSHGRLATPGMGLTSWRGAWANSLLPVTDVSHHAARAYVAWLRLQGVYAALRLGQPDLPTEWEWHLAAQRLRAGGGSDGERFNHAGLRWRRPSPVGVFAADVSLDGVTDLRGNVRQWCGSALGPLDLYQACTAENGCRPPGPRDKLAVRGSSYLQPADLSEPGRRQCVVPSSSAADLGLRLVLRMDLPQT